MNENTGVLKKWDPGPLNEILFEKLVVLWKSLLLQIKFYFLKLWKAFGDEIRGINTIYCEKNYYVGRSPKVLSTIKTVALGYS